MEQSSDEELDLFLRDFESWPDKKRVAVMRRMLCRMNHNQLSQINDALKPLLQRDFITLLPQRGLIHIAEMILSYLDADSLSKASSVCHEWNRIIQEGMLWRRLIDRKVKLDPIWAGLLRRMTKEVKMSKYGRQGFSCAYDKRLYFQIVRTIEKLEAKWLSGQVTTKKIICRSENSKGVYCIQYDHHKIVSGLRDNTIKIWSTKTLECTRTFHGHTGSVLCLQYDDKVIISGSSDGTVRVWDINDLDNSQPINTVKHHSEAVLHLKFKGRMMVTCSKDRSIIVWDLLSPKDIRVVSTIVGHRAAVNVVDFNETYIVSASGDRSIKVYNSETFDLLRTLNGHKRGIACLQYRDGLIVSGSSDNSIRIWNIETGNCIRILEGHDELVRCIRFDSTRIVSGAYDGKIKIWDLKAALDESNPEGATFCLRTLQKHTGRVFRLQFDEFQIVSSSHDDSIIIWDFLAD